MHPTIESYLGYLEKCIIHDPEIGCGWYRDLKKKDRVGVLATAHVILTFDMVARDIPLQDTVFEHLYNTKFDDGSWPFVSNLNHTGVVDSTAWVLLSLLVEQSPYRANPSALSDSFKWLICAQNTDGGWGITQNSQSRTASTAFALKTLCTANNREYDVHIKRGIRFLTQCQNDDGSWPSASAHACVASTAYAMMALNGCPDSKSQLSIGRAANWILSICNQTDDQLWDDYDEREEVETKVEEKFIRLTYSYPITPLAICALVATGPQDETVSKIFHSYVQKVKAHHTFKGVKTTQRHDTTYGIHDIVCSLSSHAFPQKAPPSTTQHDIKALTKKVADASLPQLFPVHQSPAGTSSSPKTNVIFFHGLGGDAVETWLNSNNNFYLPLAVCDDSMNIDVYTVGYANASSAWAGDAMSLYDRAKNIMKLLEVSPLAGGKLILVGHSFGGLLIKSIICGIHTYESKESAARNILNSVAGVCFISTPHFGSSLANFAKSLSVIYRATVSTKDLTWLNDDLLKLNQQYKTISNDLNIKHISFYETQTTYKTTVVNQASADVGIPGSTPIPIDSNHIDIAKPDGDDALLTRSISKFISDANKP